jgi:hypothetical protein
MNTKFLKASFILCFALALIESVSNSHAAAYASDLTNNAGVVSFRLNENAQGVSIISSGGTVTNDLGARSKGLTVTNLGIAPGAFKVQVIRAASAGYVQTSSDSATNAAGIYINKFEHPRGVIVNKNPATPSFGRIYVSVVRYGITASPVRTNYDGIYLLNADDTVALDTEIFPRTAGLDFNFSTPGVLLGETFSPFRLSIGKDDNRLYISDDSDLKGGLWVTDLDVATNSVATNVFDVVGDLNNGATTHGSIYSAVVEGTLGGSNLKIFTMDEDLSPVKSAWRYDVNGGPLPSTTNATGLGQTMISATIKLVKGGYSNYLYASQNRSAGTDAPSIRIFTEDGTEVANSLDASRTYLGNPSAADLFRNTVSMDISPDGKTLALLRGVSFGRVWLVPITNGVFDFANTNSFAIGLASDNNRDLAHDAAGNIYIVSSSGEWLRIYSRGGVSVFTTGSDGTFTEGVAPSTIVSITNTVPTTAEGSGTPAVITFTRAGDTTGPLTVNYSVGGTATAGSNYTALAGSIIFAAGATSTNLEVLSISDGVSGPSLTVTVNPGASGGYVGLGSATVTILDSGMPLIKIAQPTQSTILECSTGSKATFQLTRLGSLASPTTVNLSYSGAAAAGTDINAPSTIIFPASTGTSNLVITAVEDSLVETNEPFTVTVAADAGYTVGSPSSASGLVVSGDVLAEKALAFSDAFDSDTSANWLVSQSPDFDSSAEFGTNYGTGFGIPEAPSSPVGSAATRGLIMRAHLGTSAVAPGISASPLNGEFPGDYRLRFDLWMNYGGPLDVGIAGSTEHFSAGVGVTGTEAVYPSSGAGGIWFASATDGDVGETSLSQADYAVFVGPSLQPAASGYYAAGTNTTSRGNADPYYAVWGDVTAPAAQLSLYSIQTKSVRAGALGMAWHCVTITKKRDEVTWDIDGRRLGTVPVTASGATMSQNVAVGFFDWFSSTNGNPRLEFALYDNVVVEVFVTIQSVNVINSGTQIQMEFTSAVGDSTSSFTLQRASAVEGPYSDVSATITQTSPGHFQAVRAVESPAFYRIKHL